MSDDVKAVDSLPLELQDAVKNAEEKLLPARTTDLPHVRVEHTVLEREKLSDFVDRFELDLLNIVTDPDNRDLFHKLAVSYPHDLPSNFVLEKDMRIFIGLTHQAHANYHAKLFASIHKRMDRMERQLMSLHKRTKDLD